MNTPAKKTVHVHEYKNKSGKMVVGYQGIKGDKNKAAVTHASFVILGMLKVKGNQLTKGDRERDLCDLKMVMGKTAPAYWIKQEWIKGENGKFALTVKGLNVLTERFVGKSRPAYNTDRKAVQLVTSIMRKGGKNDIGFNPSIVKV